MASSAAGPSSEARSWSSLPAGVLRHVLRLVGTCQVPGSCYAAPVCRDWRVAAAGCSHVRLLYAAGSQQRDESFMLWLARNSQQLESFTIASSGGGNSTNMVLCMLANIAAAAAAASPAAAALGCLPLQLHTLRVFGAGPDLDILGRLLSGLPRLHTLQLDVSSSGVGGSVSDFSGPLQQATQLQELYFKGPQYGSYGNNEVAAALPASLKRLSFETGDRLSSAPNLSHLSNLAFLHLERFLMQEGPLSTKLPPSLQELEAVNIPIQLADLKQESQILTGSSCVPMYGDDPELLPRFTKMNSLFYVPAHFLESAGVCAALGQLPALSSMEVFTQWANQPLQPLFSAAQSHQGLRRLRLSLVQLTGDPRGLSALNQVTRLELTSMGDSQEQEQRAWVAELGRMAGLRWLSVPDVLLATEQAWLGGLPKLQVLVVHNQSWMMDDTIPQVLPQVVEGLVGCSPEALPPRLLLLGFTHMSAEEGAAVGVRRLQQRLASSGCEVVVGVDLDEVGHPMKQLAGLPVALQQALA